MATADLDARQGARERVVILGSGWGVMPRPTIRVSNTGYVLSRQLSAKKFHTLVISPRTYLVFTPLLNESAVGTLEFRTTVEPVRNRRYPNVEFMQGWADDVDFDGKTVRVEESVLDVGQAAAHTGGKYEGYSEQEERREKGMRERQGKMWQGPYDKLVIASYVRNKGVKENAYFLKDIADATRIRRRVLECFEIAMLPTTEDKLREHLLNFAIIGGGPTGMEFAAELSDLVHEDLLKLYPSLKGFVKVTVYDIAPKVLSMFDESLAKYAMETFQESISRSRPSIMSRSFGPVYQAAGWRAEALMRIPRVVPH
ncbi:hypothetical protein MMC13_005794 [Lambiella insularis]|nr:hypothetical protein [Lambiella insularis]